MDLERFKPYVGRSNVEAVGLGRNCTVFNIVSRWAYRNVLDFKKNGVTRAGWLREVGLRCLSVNGDFPTPMLENEVKCIAKSIGNWVWTRFTPQSKSAWHSAQNARRKTHGAGSGRTKIITEL